MVAEIFIDTGAWIALLDRRDPYHAAIAALYPLLIERWPVWITTNLIIGEAYVNIQRRGGYAIAMQFLTMIETAAALQTIYSDLEVERSAREILRRYRDQDFSYVDAVSFAVMRSRNIVNALAFDHHFTTAGFTRVIQQGS